MKSSLLSSIALCACPPVIVATTVMAPPREAVHHQDKPAPHHHAAKTAALPPELPPCLDPAPAAFLARTPMLPDADAPDAGLPLAIGEASAPTPAAGTPLLPVSQRGILSGPALIRPLGPNLDLAVGPRDVPTDPATPISSAVPEPDTWALSISGFGLVGAALRRARFGSRPRARGRRSFLLRRLGIVGGVGSAAGPLQFATVQAKQVLLTKAALCVCPVAMMAMAAATVPPVRNALFSAGLPALPAAAPPACTSAPKDDSVVATLPDHLPGTFSTGSETSRRGDFVAAAIDTQTGLTGSFGGM